MRTLNPLRTRTEANQVAESATASDPARSEAAKNKSEYPSPLTRRDARTKAGTCQGYGRAIGDAERASMSYASEVRITLDTLPVRDRAKLLPSIWSDCLAGRLSEVEAEELASLAQHAPQTLPRVTPSRPRREPRSPDKQRSLERRRRVAASGAIPPALAAFLTQGEAAVLSVVAHEVRLTGSCTLPIDAIAARAGVSRRLAQMAVRKAQTLGFVSVETRRVRAFRCLPNVVRIVSPEWVSWLRLARVQNTAEHGYRFNPLEGDRLRKAIPGGSEGQERGFGEKGRRVRRV